MAEPLIGVTGATGEVGGRVARRLAERGRPQRLVVRDPARAPRLDGAEVLVASGYGDAGAMRAALEGVEVLFLVSAAEAPDRVEQHATALDAAAAAGVGRVVYLSFLGAAPDATFTFARDHWATERHALGLGLDCVFLRQSLYLDFLPLWVGADGVLRGPAGDGRVAAVARHDVADAAVAVLTGEGQAAGACEVTGGEALTFTQVAERMTRATGRPVAYAAETLEEAYASRRPSGAPDWQIDGWVSTYAAIAAGEMDVVADTVPRLTGRPVRTLEEQLAAHPESWAHIPEEAQ